MKKKERKRIRRAYEKAKDLLTKDQREEYWLFTDWFNMNNEFKIYTSFEDHTFITGRNLRVDGKQAWFCIDNLFDEIKEYGEKHNLNLKGIGETIKSIHDDGYSHDRKDIEESTKEAELRNKKGIGIVIID